MRSSLLLLSIALGCSASTSSSPAAVDGGTEASEGGTPESPCFGDGWCADNPPNVPGLMIDVWASATDDVWALAQDTTLFRWDGKAWSRSKLPGSQADAIWGRARDDVWASVDGGIQHWDGKAWTAESVAPRTSLLRFAVDAKGTVWARSGANGLYRRDGAIWAPVLPDGLTTFGGASIASCGDKLWFGAWLLGEYDGAALWLHGASEDDDRVIAAGTYGAGKAWVSSRYLRRYVDGTFKPNLLERAPKGLFAMSVASDTEAWALAEGPKLWSFDGKSWKSWTTDVKDTISVSWSKPGFVRLMRRNGAIVETELATGAQTLLAQPAWVTIASAAAHATWVSPTDAYYADGGSMYRWREGSDKWQSVGSADAKATVIFAPTASSAWIAGGTNLRHWNGTKQLDVNTGVPLDADETWLAVGGNDDNDVWALSTKRNFHFDGAKWKAFPSGFAAGTVARALGVGGGRSWFFRDRGRFARFDGSAAVDVVAEPVSPTYDFVGCQSDGQMLGVSQEPTEIWKGPPGAMKKVADTYPNLRPIDVWYGPKGEAWLLGANDGGGRAISYWDGAALRPSVDKPGGSRSYLALWALPSGEAWAVGYGGIAHRRP